MQDNQLYKIIIPLIKSGLSRLGISALVQQGYQATQQGVPTEPTVFLYKIGDTPIGAPQQLAKWKINQAASFTASFSAGIMTVSAIASGAIVVGQTIQGAGVPENTIVTGLGTGLGNTGTYQVGQSFTLASVACTSIQGMENTQLQQYQTTFQCNALSIQDPSNTNQLTASDLVNYVRSIVQSDTFITALESQGVGILRPSIVRNPYFIDDKARFEANPSFDFTLTHKQSIFSTNPVVTAETFTVLSV